MELKYRLNELYKQARILLIVLNGIEISLYSFDIWAISLLIVLNGIEIYLQHPSELRAWQLLIVLNGIEISEN